MLIVEDIIDTVCLGKNVLIVEDIIDTGKTMNKLLNTLREIFLVKQIFGSKSIIASCRGEYFLEITSPLLKINFPREE